MGKIVSRLLTLPDLAKHSVFLWGPRRTGKTYWIRRNLPDAPLIDLLQTDTFAEYASRPSLLRERHSAQNTSGRRGPIVIDEIQKLPALLDEVHWLMENRKRYVNDYLKEESVAEGLAINLPAFSDFLRVAALTSSELLNYTNVAREVGVSAKVVRGYFDLLEDTLLGFRVAPWTKSRNRRLIQTPKFYLFDLGIANFLARRQPKPGTPEFGKSVEHLVLMELMAFRSYRNQDLEIRYWRTSTGQEVDFILNDRDVAIEIKTSTRVADIALKPLGVLADDGPVRRRIVVCMERQPREISDRHGRITILPVHRFLEELWAGKVV